MATNKSNAKVSQRSANLLMATLAAQGGCFTLILVIGALLLGLWLDAQMGLRGPFTIGLLLLSVPLSLFVMVRVAMSAIQRIQPPSADEVARMHHPVPNEEEDQR